MSAATSDHLLPETTRDCAFLSAAITRNSLMEEDDSRAPDDEGSSEKHKETHEHLVQNAYKGGMAVQEDPTSFPRLHPSTGAEALAWERMASATNLTTVLSIFVSALHACSGTDIVHSSTHRKSKFLFALPGQILFTKGGAIGRITHMDTPNPILYLNFPQVRHLRAHTASQIDLNWTVVPLLKRAPLGLAGIVQATWDCDSNAGQVSRAAVPACPRHR